MRKRGQGWGRRAATGPLVAALLSVSALSQAAAQDAAQAREYDACMHRAMSDPEAGFEQATAWRELGGGEPAQHCVAVALYGLGHFEEAALRMERLAESGRFADPTLRIDLLGQAGNAWLMAGDAERAFATLSAGLALAPNDVDLLIDRSLALALAKNFWTALDDLDRALELTPDNAGALVFRASTYRYLDSLDLARADIDAALALDPDNQAALLESGIIRRLQGDPAGAREAWLTLLRLDAEGPAAEAAQRNLELLDLRAD